MAKGDDLEDRLVDFSVRVIKVCASLPNTEVGKHVGGQLMRSGTAAAAHYAEAHSAESNKDFVHKLKIGLKELNESRVWLKIIARSDLLSPNRLDSVLSECDELGRILNASIKTARTN